jgi:hypothetical protein
VQPVNGWQTGKDEMFDFLKSSRKTAVESPAKPAAAALAAVFRPVFQIVIQSGGRIPLEKICTDEYAIAYVHGAAMVFMQIFLGKSAAASVGETIELFEVLFPGSKKSVQDICFNKMNDEKLREISVLGYNEASDTISSQGRTGLTSLSDHLLRNYLP